MPSILRLSALRERLRASLWVWPSVAVAAAIALGIALPVLELEIGDGKDALGFAGTPDGARSVLATVAGSMITVTGLTFSLTVVALQMASTQFTPRLMRTFLSDGGNQAVLSTFLATFAYTLAVLRSVRSTVDEGGGYVPDIAVSVGLGLTVLSVGMLVYFIHHLTHQLRVESVLHEVTRDTIALVERTMSPLGDPREPVRMAGPVPDLALPLRVRRSGYLQAVDASVLQQMAQREGVSLWLRPFVGTHVTVGSTVGWATPAGADPARQLDADALASAVHEGLQIGDERTLQQDVAFGIRQLVDIAARALSPGINDPTTAVATLHALADVLATLISHQQGDRVIDGDDGQVVLVPGATFSGLLGLACDQPRRYGRDEPAVLSEMLRLLTDLAEVARTEAQREAIRDQIEATVGTAATADLSQAEQGRLEGLARDARTAVDAGTRSADGHDDEDHPAS